MVFTSMRAAPPTCRHLRHWERVCRCLDAQPHSAVSLPLPADPPGRCACSSAWRPFSSCATGTAVAGSSRNAGKQSCSASGIGFLPTNPKSDLPAQKCPRSFPSSPKPASIPSHRGGQMTPHELRHLPLEARRHARLAALDAVLRELCPRAPSAAEVQRTAARLYSRAPSTLQERPTGMPTPQSHQCMYAHSSSGAIAARRAPCRGMASVPGDGLEHHCSPDDQRVLERGNHKDHLTCCQSEQRCGPTDGSTEPPELLQPLPASDPTFVASDGEHAASTCESNVGITNRELLPRAIAGNMGDDERVA